MESLLTEALTLALTLALPALGACLLIALLTTILQGALQAGDAAVGFVPKLLVVLGVLWFSRGFLSDHLLAFTSHLIAVMSRVGR